MTQLLVQLSLECEVDDTRGYDYECNAETIMSPRMHYYIFLVLPNTSTPDSLCLVSELQELQRPNNDDLILCLADFWCRAEGFGPYYRGCRQSCSVEAT